jgi:DNA replication protein DnaC
MYTRENYQKIKEMIAARKERAEMLADMRRRELATRSSEIAAIDRKLRGVGLEIFRAACAGEDIKPIREKNLALSAKRRDIIRSLGLPEDYDKPDYTCKKCSDSGFTDDSRICSCFKEALTVLNIESSGMGKLIEKQSFDTFDLSWYEGQERERAELILSVAKRFVKSFGRDTENLLFIGNTGTGKTHISTAIAKEIITRGFDVLYDSAQNIFSDFETDKFKSGYSPQYEAKAEKYLECDLLIIDDLGAEFVSQFTVSCLYNLINTRKNRGLSTIISTNLSPEELGAKYEGRISSRLMGEYTVLPFLGKDHRIFS